MSSKSICGLLLIFALPLTAFSAETICLFPTDMAAIFGNTAAGEREARLLVDFDLSQIPAGASIRRATLRFDGVEVPSELGLICLYAAEVTTDWDSDNATWYSPDENSDWENVGGDWTYDFGDYNCLSFDSEAGVWLNLTSMIIRKQQKPNEFKGLILFPVNVSEGSINLQLEVVGQLKLYLEIEYFLNADIGGSRHPDQPVAD